LRIGEDAFHQLMPLFQSIFAGGKICYNCD